MSDPSPEQMRVGNDTLYVSERLKQFYSDEERDIWMASAQTLLDGETPMALIHADKTEKVMEVIQMMEELPYL